MSSFLVTGAAGFIGSHIAESLIARKDSAVILDDMSAGNRENLSVNPAAKVYIGSILDEKLLDTICSENEIDGIFHLGAVASVKKSIENPSLIHKVNCTGTLNILEAARKHDIEKVVLSASAAAYGDDPVFPKTEDMMPAPLSPYATSKIAAEMYVRNYTDLYGMKNTSLRYFNVYGPRQDPNGEYAAVISKFTERITKGQGITIYGDGKQTRDFVYVKDVASANLLAMDNRTSAAAGLFNIGTGIQTSLNELAEMIMASAGVTVDIRYEAVREGDVRFSCADISKAERVLGYHPQYSLAEGIDETVKAFGNGM
ncbi:MAG TPA: GDP-mannose 4,6-dehydratase [Methanocorpusculum sp.]|nr:GDP-mannose 4,6-dehydratase [Methanocorpusculum sp.]HJJ39525.1 GDP-mannose 4,6-dehydratase [Methanocorpusculum sp.]